MSKTNAQHEVKRARELATALDRAKSALRTQDEELAGLRAEHGAHGDPETIPAHIARLFDDALAPTPIHPFAPSARPRGPFVRG